MDFYDLSFKGEEKEIMISLDNISKGVPDIKDLRGICDLLWGDLKEDMEIDLFFPRYGFLRFVFLNLSQILWINPYSPIQGPWAGTPCSQSNLAKITVIAPFRALGE